MATYLAYVDAVPGRLYPLVPTLLELQRRGHQVTVKAGIDDIERLRSVGLDAEPLAPPIERFEPDDWKARTRFGALMSGLRQFGERARAQADDLAQTIAEAPPDVLFIDEGAWGAAAAAERSGLPWAFSLVSAIPLTSRDAPPFGLGLRPRRSGARPADARDARTDHRLAPQPPAHPARLAAVQQDRPVLPRRRSCDRVHRRTVRIPTPLLVGQGPARRLRAVGTPRRAARMARRCPRAASACHLLDLVSERPEDRRDCVRGVRRRTTRRRHHNSRDRPSHLRPRPPTSASSGSCPTRPSSTTPRASSATPAWASPKKRSPTVYLSSPSRSAATSPK